MSKLRDAVIVVVCILALARAAWGQSSSLYGGGVRGGDGTGGYAYSAERARGASAGSRNPLLDETSFIAVTPPEPRTFALHEIVTIIVIENKRFQTDAQTKTERNFDFEAALQAWIKFTECKLGAQDFIRGEPEIDFSTESEIDNKGKLKRQDKLTYRIACEVIDVKPNGNLVLEARRRLYHDEEEIVATLTGMCRSADVSADNTVLSSKVADLDFSASHTGAMRDGTRRGWLTRLVDLFRPI
jgi:flagellar L-ring protein precursor FlgH